MGIPVTVSISHQLGRNEAKGRLGSGVDKLKEVVPGAVLHDHYWEEDDLHFTLEAMRQHVKGELQVRDDEVYAIIDLPPLLGMFANSIKDALRREGPKLLE